MAYEITVHRFDGYTDRLEVPLPDERPGWHVVSMTQGLSRSTNGIAQVTILWQRDEETGII